MSSLEQFEELGKQWVNGEVVVSEWQGVKLNEKQKEFVNNKDRFLLISGGFASGKTYGFLIKLVMMSLFFPNNLILLGRRTRQAVEVNILPDLFELIPDGLADHKVGAGKIVFPNKSEILLYGLDALQSGAGQDIKKAEQNIKSLNLGCFAIDQLEEIEERVFEGLDGRMRRKVGFNQGFATTNPANYWAYDYFKGNPRKRTKLIETSMLDNKENLPVEFIESQLDKPDVYKERYVFGKWTPDAPDASRVFPADYIKDQEFHVKRPLREFDGIKIYNEPKPDGSYQIGVDPSEGSVDPSAIVVVDTVTGETVAVFSGFVPINQVGNKTVQLSLMYSQGGKPLIVPESTGGGIALVEFLKDKGVKIYEREQFLYREKKTTMKLGFHTNYGSKKQLIENMTECVLNKFAKIRDKDILLEMKTFTYSNEVRKSGAGAQTGYHDDRLMAAMLAYWNLKPVTVREKTLLSRLNKKPKKVLKYQYK